MASHLHWQRRANGPGEVQQPSRSYRRPLAGHPESNIQSRDLYFLQLISRPTTTCSSRKASAGCSMSGAPSPSYLATMAWSQNRTWRAVNHTGRDITDATRTFLISLCACSKAVRIVAFERTRDIRQMQREVEQCFHAWGSRVSSSWFFSKYASNSRAPTC